MSSIAIDGWTADIAPFIAQQAVVEALRHAATESSSLPIALMRAARRLEGTAYAVILADSDHVAALSSGHVAYFRATDERSYSVALDPGEHDNSWRLLPPQTLLDLDYCGPTWMPLTPPWEGLEFS